MNCISGLREEFIVLGIKIDLVQILDVVRCISEWIIKKEYGNYIVIANANDALFARKNPLVRESMNFSSLTVADGVSLVILARFKGHTLKRRVYGPDLMAEFLKSSEGKGYSHFFYGATENTLKLLISNLQSRFSSLKVAGSYAPPFKPLNKEEDEAVVDMINKVSPDVVWVGLGCPKQQVWMYEHKDKLKVPVMVGVGAAFDFFAGTKPQAPRWLRDHGFEWLFRLVTEPRRLWRRYLVDYPLFIYFIIFDLVRRRIKLCKK